MQRSLLIVGPSSKTSNQVIRGYQWGATWGSEQWLDPDNDGNYDWYRTNGAGVLTYRENVPLAPADSFERIYSRPLAGGYYDGTTRSGTSYTFSAVKGALPHITDEERAYISTHLSQFLGLSEDGKPTCAIYYGTTFAYFLYEDESLPGVCNPGAYFMLRTQADYPSNQTIYEYTASFDTSDLLASGTLVSGTTTVNMRMPWIPTNDSGTTGFYMSAIDYIKPGGYLYIEAPTTTGIYVVQSALSTGAVTVAPNLTADYPNNSRISYKSAEMNKNLNVFVSNGDGMADDSSRRTYETMYTKGDMQTTTIVESFIPIPWAIPAPYSIRNVPFTNIWVRLQNPGVPLNLDTLVYKINGVDRTSEVQITLVPGGMELFYNPSENFPLNSRVSVYIYVSAATSIHRTFGRASSAENMYIKVDGDISYFQPGGQLQLGPNPVGETEANEVRAIVSSDEIMVWPTQYEYIVGDAIIYTYDDSPLEVSYWFDIVDDYLPPLIYNMYPSEAMENINTFQSIRFEIKDEGLGVDISSLTFTVNNLVVNPRIYKYSDQWYEVIYTPTYPYYYNSIVHCFATVSDNSSAKNRGYAVWSFKTAEAELPIMREPDPSQCAFPVHHMDDVKVDIYGRAGGASLPSLEFTVDQRHQNPYAYPKIYRHK
jgi:hypothetical protein